MGLGNNPLAVMIPQRKEVVKESKVVKEDKLSKLDNVEKSSKPEKVNTLPSSNPEPSQIASPKVNKVEKQEKVNNLPSLVNKERFTVSMDINLADDLRNATYWSPGYTLSSLAEEAFQDWLKKAERKRGEPFPKRAGAVKMGRPLKA